jgi:predicted nucleotidyltransferase component of viral defense system
MAAEIIGGARLKAKTYATATAFRRALEDRLAVAAKTEGVDLQRIRRQVAFDRLLSRLFIELNPPWVLKGGYALELKFATARTTKDIDLGLVQLPGSGENWEQRADELLAVLQEKVARNAGDFFEFIIGAPMMELEAAPYNGARYTVEAVLDGRTFAKFHLDIGTGDVQREPVEIVRPRDWLAFANIPASTFRSISREEHFAQKLHAYTLPRTERPNSRVKDLVDLVLLIDRGGINHERLRVDVLDTFARRKTHEAPVALDPPPDFWRPTFARMAAECAIAPDVAAQFEKVQRFYAALNLR